MKLQCKLCLNYFDRLEESHYIPKGIYKRLRDLNEKNPNPWAVSPKGAVQTSYQMKAYLLCKDCEGLFNKKGETWVLANCLQTDGTSLWLPYLTQKIRIFLHKGNQPEFILHLKLAR